MREEGRLAAILAADMVGHSRLMSVGESGTLSPLEQIVEGLRKAGLVE